LPPSAADLAAKDLVSGQIVTNLRQAAIGVALAAFGLLLQWVGSG
jgi:hypothetical protein